MLLQLRGLEIFRKLAIIGILLFMFFDGRTFGKDRGPEERAAEVKNKEGAALATLTKLKTYLKAIDATYSERVKGFGCRTGERRQEGNLVLKHVLKPGAPVVDAWLHLALPHDVQTRQVEEQWAQTAFGMACYTAWNANKLNSPFTKIMHDHKEQLINAARKNLQRNDRLDSQLQRLFQSMAMWKALPVLFEALRKNNLDPGLRRDITNLTWRNQAKLKWWEIEKLQGKPLKQWTEEFLLWWKKNKKTTSTQAIIDSAKKWELAGINQTAHRKRYILVALLMNESSSATVSDKDLVAILDSRWPRFRHGNENDKKAPAEEPIATAYAIVRDAAFLLAFKRDPNMAMKAMEAGLRRNDRILGEVSRRGLLEERKVYLFKNWLTIKIKTDIAARISNPLLDLVTRFKWLIIYDQFFPSGAPHIYSCALRISGNWSGNQMISKGHYGSFNWTTADLKSALNRHGKKNLEKKSR